ncbi:MAG TPA: EthD family reductase [Bryobacteraceae bacterium]|jgi:uncharacterized protein (TIGR02118 family)|nr:EthD family reductase [Bryobacteraceae bacterium]
MIVVSVMYPNTEGCTFDMDYYRDTHMPLVRKLIGSELKGLRAEKGLGGPAPGAPAQYVAMGHLMFDSVESAGKALQAHAPVLMSDIPNFTNVQPMIQLSEVTLDS